MAAHAKHKEVVTHLRTTNAEDYSRAAFEAGVSKVYSAADKLEKDKWQNFFLDNRMAVSIGAALALVCLLFFGGILISITTIKAEADTITTQVDAITEAMSKGKTEAIQASITTIADSAHTIKDVTTNPVMTLASFVPIVGSDVRSVQTLADVFVDISDNALMPLSDNAEVLNLKNLFVDSRFNIDALRTLSGTLKEITPVLRKNCELIVALPPAHLEQVRSPLSKVQRKLSSANKIFDALETLDLATLFGADGQTRNYILVALNNSELRAGGGFAGSWTRLTLTDGKLDMADSQSLQHHDTEGLNWTEDESAMWPAVTPTDGSGSNFTPNFVRAGERFGKTYTSATGNPVHAVIAIDPVFLQRVLGVVGGVKALDGKMIDGTNAAQMLMNEVYWLYGRDADYQDRFFEDVAKKAFEKLTDGLEKIDMGELVNVITDSAAEYRLQVWMADPVEEQLIDGLGLSGAISNDPSEPILGVYVNDNTWGKMSYYLDMRVRLGEPKMYADGTSSYWVTVSYTNTLPKEKLEDAPLYIFGGNPSKKNKADMILYPCFIAPAGGKIESVRLPDDVVLNEHTIYGLNGWEGEMHLECEQSREISFNVLVSAEAKDTLKVRRTATAQVFE